MTDAPSSLRKGWTTGACAAAAATAAWTGLTTGRFPDPVTIALPRGETPAFALSRAALDGGTAGTATAGVIKDAGDDPDVTHGAEIVATVRRAAAGSGVTFAAGDGVGTVTLPGLKLAVGEPAINPGPRAQITANLQAASDRLGLPCDVAVTVSIPGGATLAERTLNGRLGILGGLSVLGTTGIVHPYSCAAWIASIHQGVAVARAAGLEHLAASTGRTSEAAARRLLGLPDRAMIDMGDFAGAVLKALRAHPVPRLTLAGGFAKLSKLAAGHLDLHSGRSAVDFAALAVLAGDAGADAPSRAAIAAATNTGTVLAVAGAAGIDLPALIAARARAVARAALSGGTAVGVAVFDRHGGLLAYDR
jgi:cobalt-precorrin-5B (C1)-methyltransferase